MIIRIDIPRVRATFYGLCRKMYNGIKKYASGPSPAIPLQGTSEKSFSDDFTAATKTEDDFQGCRAARSGGIGDRGEVEVRITTWIGDAKSFLFRKLWGPKWVLPYAQIGFKSGSIETPTDLDGKLEVLRAIGSWLARNPAKEVVVKDPLTGADIKITSVRAGELEKELEAAINQIGGCTTDIGLKEIAREKAEEQLRGRVRLVAGELDMLLDPMDPRWLAFGLPKPGETERPSQVTGVQFTLVSPRHGRLTWEPSERVVRYKLRAFVTGKDKEPRVIAEVYEEQADLTMFAPGDEVKLDLIALNAAGDSTPSEPVTVTFPLAAVA